MPAISERQRVVHEGPHFLSLLMGTIQLAHLGIGFTWIKQSEGDLNTPHW